ncbi:MAG: TIGR01906 family membrane protein [Eubacteriales bacterium]|nr:TIGR01906 family membrane protein [Eubacteriales bacterium]
MKKTIKNILAILCAIFTIWILLVSSIEVVCYYIPGFFEYEYEKHDVLSQLPEMSMSEEDGLMAVTNHMMKYLRGDEDAKELQIVVKMGGEDREFFTERELLHMEDVRGLFIGAQNLRMAAAFMVVVLLAVIWIMEPKPASDMVKKSDLFRYDICKGLLKGSFAFLIVSAVLGIIVATNFSEAFVTFHHIFFDNDLWILDPSVDMLVNIVPEGFFFDTASLILIIFGAVMLVLVLVALYVSRKLKKDKGI